MVPRATRERIELNQELFRARAATGVSRRPLALRPQVQGYREIRIDPAGTWARVADPPIAYAPHTLPYIVPRGEGQYAQFEADPHHVPDSVWRDPSLRAHRTVLGTGNLDPTDVVNLAVDNPSTESEGSEAPEAAVDRFTAAGHSLLNQLEPIEPKLLSALQLGQEIHHQRGHASVSGFLKLLGRSPKLRQRLKLLLHQHPQHPFHLSVRHLLEVVFLRGVHKAAKPPVYNHHSRTRSQLRSLINSLLSRQAQLQRLPQAQPQDREQEHLRQGKFSTSHRCVKTIKGWGKPPSLIRSPQKG